MNTDISTHTEGKAVVLIGMPGAGKSTVGAQLARRLGWPLVDADQLIERAYGGRLQDIVDEQGVQGLREREEAVLLGLALNACVIATGGSAVYSDKAMQHLRTNAMLVFLDIDLPSMVARVDNADKRGLARAPGQSLQDLYTERLPLYQRYATATIDCRRRSVEEITEAVENLLR